MFKEVRVWRLPEPTAGSQHPFKYRLALVSSSSDQCVLRYDNERGKGDHKPIGDQEFALTFTSMPQLLIGFDCDIQRWREVHKQVDD